MMMAREGQSALGILFSWGFRPFFLAAGLYAGFGIVAWLLTVTAIWSPDGRLGGSLWHGHEMLFGFAMAVVAGFFLTAIPNWTGLPRVQGGFLMVLVAAWLAGRLAVWSGDWLPDLGVMALDGAFLPLLLVTAAWFILAKRNFRQLPLLVVLLFLAACNVVFHLQVADLIGGDPGRTILAAIDAVVLLIAVIGGRIVPSFTANMLRGENFGAEVRLRPPVDIGALVLTATLLPLDWWGGAEELSGHIALIAGALHFWRLSGWQGHRTIGQPIVWVLHLGYGWLAAGLMIRGLAPMVGDLSATAAMHGLTIGAIGTMTLAVMSRAALGHTGRPLRAPSALWLAYLAPSLAVVFRIAADVAPADYYTTLMAVSGASWTAGFALFLLIYAPILLGPARVSESS
jgi:uncharacterized protein involved in response to NO